jgi:hypothetical protein
MASRQRLKKEIDFIVSDLVIDCFTFMTMKQDQENKDVLKIVEDTINLRNELRYMVNHPEKKEEAQSVKNYYDNIAKVLVSNIEGSYEKLGAFIAKGQE